MPQLLSLLIILAAFLLPCPALAGKGSLNSTLESNVIEQQKRIKQVQKAMGEKRDLLRDSQNREVNLLGQLEELDQALGSGRGQLAQLTQAAAAKRAEIQRRNAELASIATAKERAREHVKKRLAAFYRMGEVGMLNVVFSSTSLTDLLNIKESFRILIDQDQKTIGGYHQQLDNLTRLRDELEKENAQLQQVISESEKQTKRLADNRSSRLKLLASIGNEKRLYQQALAEMEGAAANLNQTLNILREKLAASQSNPQPKQPSGGPKSSGAASSFAALKGRLPPPVRGTVTTNFGKNNQGKFGITTSTAGIDIKTLAGTEVTAIHKGKVIYVGQLRGYGNLLIIDHGQQYYSLMARATEFYKKVGEQVEAGEVLGIMSDQGGLLGEGLHFEIRRGTEPENPLDWVNRSQLKINPDAQGGASDRKVYKNN
ncbi:MAG: peptidoglycan DD-metalloendopeptidase family protein [Desulfobulbaceae bacterium]|nr:peptidoglycan DD-metalloendopeptidase family protein [Desulfobulbaceae bacterium]